MCGLPRKCFGAASEEKCFERYCTHNLLLRLSFYCVAEPRRDHAIVMSRFARECLAKSSEVFHYLELTLGPGTSALDLRLGLHSGPVTAGVLRGEKSRFQLFGDVSCFVFGVMSAGESNAVSQLMICEPLVDRRSTQRPGWNPIRKLAKSIAARRQRI